MKKLMEAIKTGPLDRLGRKKEESLPFDPFLFCPNRDSFSNTVCIYDPISPDVATA